MTNQHPKDPMVAWCSEPKCLNPIGLAHYKTSLYQRTHRCQMCLLKKGWNNDKKVVVDCWKRGN